MPNSPLFSIIIPTYNRAKLLPNAIESVLAQSYDHWELIIVDDGSTDETSEVVDKYLHDERIRYLWQENRGRSSARNIGTQNATGAYLCYLDDDDFFLPNHLETINRCIQQQPTPCIVRTEAYRIHPDGTKYESPLLYLNPAPSDHIFLHGSGLIFYAFPQEISHHQTFAPHLSTGEDWHYILRAITRLPMAFTQQVSATFHYSPMPVEAPNKVQLFLRWQSLFLALNDLEKYKNVLESIFSSPRLWQRKKNGWVRQAFLQSIYLFDWPLFSLTVSVFFSRLRSQHLHEEESK
jgi:glycosyltransferase involved in cell wall biosynthesis